MPAEFIITYSITELSQYSLTNITILAFIYPCSVSSFEAQLAKSS